MKSRKEGPSEHGNVYVEGVDVIEQKRLETFSYPHYVSCQLLSEIGFRSLIDAGAGPDAKLAQYVVQERGAEYSAFDVGKTSMAGAERNFADIMRDKLREQGITARVFHADIRDIPPEVGRADVVHERFVLMHLPDEARHAALTGLLAIADHKVILMEYNWRPIGSAAHSSLISRFVEMSFEVMRLFHVDAFAGETMQPLVRQIVDDEKYEFKSFLRAEGNYSMELVQLSLMQSRLAIRAGNNALAQELKKLADKIERSPVTFVPAEIVAAVISR